MHLDKFIKQKSYEHIQYILHRHPLTFLPTILVFLLLASIPLVIYVFTSGMFASEEGAPPSPVSIVATLAASAYYLSILIFFYTQFIIYYLDVWVVTDDRVIDVDQKTLFSRSISELDLASIQDVTTDIKGFFPTLFDYGDVMVKTASDNPNIIFRNVPHPNKIRADLVDLSDKDKQRHLRVEGVKR